ncbi:hypothetical protein IIB79_09725 [candidate division KSB1 bacterium]|nr:hypothetical protein [candidate division KSB1 bacterium]
MDAVQDILSSFRSLQQKPKVYKNILDFTALLEKRIIPKIKEMLDLFPMNYKTNTGRVLAMNNEEPYLVSYMILPNFKDDRTYYGGFYWNLDSIKHKIIPYSLDRITRESDFHFKTLDDRDSNSNGGEY